MKYHNAYLNLDVETVLNYKKYSIDYFNRKLEGQGYRIAISNPLNCNLRVENEDGDILFHVKGNILDALRRIAYQISHQPAELD